MAIQRNAIVAPFSVNTPLLEKTAPRRKGEEGAQVVATSHQKWFQQLANGVNATPQIASHVPVSSNSAGQPGTIAFDANWLYVCVGVGIWRRAALNSF